MNTNIELPNLCELHIGDDIGGYAPTDINYAQYPDIHSILYRLADDQRAVNIPTAALRKNGDCRQDNMEKYLSANEYLSSGQLKAALKTPLHFFYELDQGWKDELEKCKSNQGKFQLGTFLHECILEPTKFSRVIVEPAVSLSTTKGADTLLEFWQKKVDELCDNGNELIRAVEDSLLNDVSKIQGKREYIAKLKESSGLFGVDENQYIQIKVTESNYNRYADGILPKLLKWSKREISFYAQDEQTGIKMRVRPDAIQFAENIGVDAVISIKSTSTENLDHFYYQTANLNYEFSEGMYQEVISQVTGRQFLTTIMIMLQTVPPFGVACLMWDPEDLEIGKYKFRYALQTAKECMEKKNFPGFDAYAESGNLGIIRMKQPQWNAKPLQPLEIGN